MKFNKKWVREMLPLPTTMEEMLELIRVTGDLIAVAVHTTAI